MMRIYCKSERIGNPLDGYEFECGYGNVDFNCDECIINGGNMSPQTNKQFRGNPKPYIEVAKNHFRLKSQEEMIEIKIFTLLKGV